MMRALDSWVVRQLLVGSSLNGELDKVSEAYRALAVYLNELPPESRQTAWDGYLCGRGDRDSLVDALVQVDLASLAPDSSASRTFATLADIALMVSSQPWLWRNWIAASVLNAVAAEPGTGKTRFALDLAFRLWFKLPWPDGQTNEWPAETRTLWIPGDRNFAEMLQVARDFGLPEDAVALGTTPDEPMGGLNLDEEETLAALEEHIQAAKPAMVVIDTVGMVTSHNLCRPEEARAFFAPLIELANKTGVAFLGLTHLSANKEALGRRIVEKARVVLKMTQPDPEGQTDRRRLWVDKTAVVKPPALGVTMMGAGNQYDFNPPSEPEATTRKRGPAPEKLEACKKWLTDKLTPNPLRVTDVRKESDKAGIAAATLYAAVKALAVEESTVDGRKWWTLAAASEAPTDEASLSE
jgi:hypothetical protein